MVKNGCVYILIVLCLVVYTLTGCATTGRTDASSNILEYQRKASLLEARIALYESAVGGAVSELRELAERSSSLDGGIDEIISLFDEYQRGVAKLIQRYSEVTGTGEY